MHLQPGESEKSLRLMFKSLHPEPDHDFIYNKLGRHLRCSLLSGLLG